MQPFPADQRLFYPGTRVVQPASASEGLSGDIMNMTMPLLDLNNNSSSSTHGGNNSSNMNTKGRLDREAEKALEKLVSE